VTTAEDGQPSSRAGAGYYLIFMDCQLPRVDGYQATAAIRVAEVGHVPIVALTAHAVGGERERCLAAGMDDYLSKPLRRETLDGALERWLAGGAAPVPSAGDAGAEQADLEPAMIAQLRSLDAGHPGFFRELVDNFATASEALLADLPARIAARDREAVRVAAHRLKGTAANLGANRLSEVCAPWNARRPNNGTAWGTSPKTSLTW